MSQVRILTAQDFEAIQEAEETLRQIIKQNTAPDGHEARRALRLLGSIGSKTVQSDGPQPPEAA